MNTIKNIGNIKPKDIKDMFTAPFSKLINFNFTQKQNV